MNSAGIVRAVSKSRESDRDVVLGRIPAPRGGDPPDNRLNWPSKTTDLLVESLTSELVALGVSVFEAATTDDARAYAARITEESGGDAVLSSRPAVQRLHLDGKRFHLAHEFPASEAAVSITEADFALADSGTVMLFSAAGEGRSLSLLAPVNIVVLPCDRILAHLPEFFLRVPDPASVSSATVLVTGPSRTADIELTLTVGVHGPRAVHVIVLRSSSES